MITIISSFKASCGVAVSFCSNQPFLDGNGPVSVCSRMKFYWPILLLNQYLIRQSVIATARFIVDWCFPVDSLSSFVYKVVRATFLEIISFSIHGFRLKWLSCFYGQHIWKTHPTNFFPKSCFRINNCFFSRLYWQLNISNVFAELLSFDTPRWAVNGVFLQVYNSINCSTFYRISNSSFRCFIFLLILNYWISWSNLDFLMLILLFYSQCFSSNSHPDTLIPRSHLHFCWTDGNSLPQPYARSTVDIWHMLLRRHI